MHFVMGAFEEPTASRSEERVPMANRWEVTGNLRSSENVPRKYSLRGIGGIRNIIADRVLSMTRRRKASMKEFGQLRDECSSKVEHT